MWVPHDTRDEVVDFIHKWAEKTGISLKRLIGWLGISLSKFYSWKRRFGRVNEHNAWIPRDHWLEAWEQQAIIDYFIAHPFEGYRRLAFMMLDENVVAVSPSSVYRVLKKANLLTSSKVKPTKKGQGFAQPSSAHQHWHVDIAVVNLHGTFCFLCMVLDGYSRTIVHWEIGSTMTNDEVQLIIQRGREKYPKATPRIITDNGPQFISKDFKSYIRLTGLTHVKTRPYYPQSNGKIERVNRTVKTALKKNVQSIEELRKITEAYVAYYNTKRLNSAIGYIAPHDKLAGQEKEIFADRDRKLAAAREARTKKRSQNTGNEVVKAKGYP